MFKKGLISLIIISVMLGFIAGCHSNRTSMSIQTSSPVPTQPAKGNNIDMKEQDSTAQNTQSPVDSPNNITKITFESKLLKKSMKFNVYLPNGYHTKEKYPVLYILHGFSNNEDEWINNIKIHEMAEKLTSSGKIKPMIIISPQIDNSYLVNTSELPNSISFGNSDPKAALHTGMYEDYFIKELVPYIDSHYSTVSSREGRYVGGISMGGFAALHIAFRNMDMFSKVGGHSPALQLDNIPKDILFPDEKALSERYPIRIAKSKDLSKLKILIDCGEEDPYVLMGTRDMNEALKANKSANFEYCLGKGTHDYTYWMSNLEKYLVFYNEK